MVCFGATALIFAKAATLPRVLLQHHRDVNVVTKTSNTYLYFFFFFFLVVLGCDRRVSHLLSRHSTT
jgi:hypothetical protein